MNTVEKIFSSSIKREAFQIDLRKRGIMSMSESIMKCRKKGTKGLIVEFKRSSPTGFTGSGERKPVEYFRSVISEKVVGLSVLTEPDFFGGSYYDLAEVQHLQIPILDKDFVCSRDMVMSARNAGADSVLLISDFLSEDRVNDLSEYARALGMEVLLEFHDPDSLKIPKDTDGVMLGYNRRNLKTLRIEEEESGIETLASYDGIRVIESGIDSSNYARINNLDCDAMLIGRAVLEGDILPGDA